MFVYTFTTYANCIIRCKDTTKIAYTQIFLKKLVIFGEFLIEIENSRHTHVPREPSTFYLTY